MAKTAKNDRRARAERAIRASKGSERTRGLLIVGVCAVVAVAIIVAAAWNPIKDQIQTSAAAGKPLQDIGQSAQAAGCATPYTIKADGNQEHEPTGTIIKYTTAPPAFGPHWNEAGIAPVTMSRKFYDPSDTPQLEQLVHNLEHGYTLLWYDATVANNSSELNQIRAIADKFAGTDDWRDKFIAVPWTAAEEKATYKPGDPLTQFPAGKHIAFTHWSQGGIGDTNVSDQVGAFQYCTGVSGAALKSFMTRFPYTDSPEPVSM